MDLVSHKTEKQEDGSVHFKARFETKKKGAENVRITVKIEDLHNPKQHCEFKVHSETVTGGTSITVDTLHRVQQTILKAWDGDHIK